MIVSSGTRAAGVSQEDDESDEINNTVEKLTSPPSKSNEMLDVSVAAGAEAAGVSQAANGSEFEAAGCGAADVAHESLFDEVNNPSLVWVEAGVEDCGPAIPMLFHAPDDDGWSDLPLTSSPTPNDNKSSKGTVSSELSTAHSALFGGGQAISFLKLYGVGKETE